MWNEIVYPFQILNDTAEVGKWISNSIRPFIMPVITCSKQTAVHSSPDYIVKYTSDYWFHPSYTIRRIHIPNDLHNLQSRQLDSCLCSTMDKYNTFINPERNLRIKQQCVYTPCFRQWQSIRYGECAISRLKSIVLELWCRWEYKADPQNLI